MKRTLVLLLVIIMAFATLGSCRRKEQGDSRVVKVAVITALSGTSIRMSEIYDAAIKAAMKAIEEDGLLQHGYTLEFHWVDDRGTVDGAPPAANLALDQHRCHVSIGHYLTIQILASGSFFEERRVPLLGIVSGPAAVAQGFNYFSMATATDLFQADTLL